PARGGGISILGDGSAERPARRLSAAAADGGRAGRGQRADAIRSPRALWLLCAARVARAGRARHLPGGVAPPARAALFLVLRCEHGPRASARTRGEHALVSGGSFGASRIRLRPLDCARGDRWLRRGDWRHLVVILSEVEGPHGKPDPTEA